MANKDKNGASGKINVYELVNDRIIAEMEKGIIPWQRPWTGLRSGAYNRVTGRPYSLLNQMLLGKPGEYMSFNQAVAAGGHVRKGEKSHLVVFWKPWTVTEKDDAGAEKKKHVFLLKYDRVFHIDQCEGVEPRFKSDELPTFDPVEEAERIIEDYSARSGCPIQHTAQNRAFYSPGLDVVSLPLKEQFPDRAEYYSVAYHECAHSTGHPSRLNRFELGHAFGSEPYGKEELVAEITAASLMCGLGIESKLSFSNTIAYLQNWIRAIKGDPKLLISAAGKAEKAMNLILGIETANASPDTTEGVDTATTTSPTPDAAATQPPKSKVTSTRKGKSQRDQLKRAAVAFAKRCAKEMENRPNLAGAFVKNGRQYITNGFYGVAYDVPFEGLQTVPDTLDEESMLDFERVIAPTRVGLPVDLPTLREMRQARKDAKQVGNSCPIMKLGEQYFNIEYLLRAMELVGLDGGNGTTMGAMQPLYLHGVDCEAVLLPVRMSGDAQNRAWEYKKTA